MDFTEESPDVTFDDIGGLDDVIAKLRQRLERYMKSPGLRERFGLSRLLSILIEGPPRNGKTMTARALANWMGHVSEAGTSCFFHARTDGMTSAFLGASERNIHRLLRTVRERGEQNPDIPIVILIDKIDKIEPCGAYDDRDHKVWAMVAGLQELDAGGNILVIGEANRARDMPSALAKFGDLRIVLPRPDMSAARDIFTKYLSPDLPYEGPDGSVGQAAQREDVIDAAASGLFVHNSANELAKLMMLDGTCRIVTPVDLVSGELIASIADEALHNWYLRVDTARQTDQTSDIDRMGICVGDVLTVINDRFAGIASGLTPRNIRYYIRDLSEDIPVSHIELDPR